MEANLLEVVKSLPYLLFLANSLEPLIRFHLLKQSLVVLRFGLACETIVLLGSALDPYLILN